MLTRKDYVKESSAVRRHEVIASFGLDAITLGDYATLDLCRFRRTFGAGIDDEPSPTASNNFQTADVMNGSKIDQFEATIKLASKSGSTAQYFDVYAFEYSFSDALWLETLYNVHTPTEFNHLGGAPNVQGQVNFKAVHVTFSQNNFKNFKGMQRHIKHLGTVYLSTNDGGSTSAEFTIRGLPAKCRRSQTGMFYGLIFHLSTEKNSIANASVTESVEIKFRETPSSNRLPFVW